MYLHTYSIKDTGPTDRLRDRRTFVWPSLAGASGVGRSLQFALGRNECELDRAQLGLNLGGISPRSQAPEQSVSLLEQPFGLFSVGAGERLSEASQRPAQLHHGAGMFQGGR